MSGYQPYNEFSSVSGGGGGGFENSQGNSRPNTGSGGGSQSTLMPVTIKQVLESKQMVQDGPFVIQNLELHHVVFVGVVRNVVDKTSNITLTVEDGTGQIDVRQWTADPTDIANANEQNGKQEGSYSSQISQMYQVGTYVKVFGALREFSGKKNVQYAVVKPIESFNDVIAHHLSAMKCHAIANGTLQSPAYPNTDSTGINNNNNPQPGQDQSLFVQDNSANDPKPALHKILEFCAGQCEGKDASNFAVHTKLIEQSLGISEADVKMYCQTLVDQGFIYPTFDDSSFFVL
ncbi:LAME_0F15456g1_1 [Lachancea meyersii CBS 8951]|uniref:LAME_0F15456g1_1 n=1 Tax=Lachancea meyersii CBS 8951 TaxID=1266667 RepID=A0A1G4JYS0_9SACH|nr:LAME_0F15456g1_1 [Lachancea meyersii CBS 8951]